MKSHNYPFSLEQLLILRAIAVHKSFKEAAQTLCLTQPAVSIQMQHLEKQLQITLFDRGKKQIEFTETGLLLVRYSVRILNLCSESARALEDFRSFQNGTLLVGATQTSGTYLMPKVIGLFQQFYPSIEIQLQVDSTRKIVSDVLTRKLDIGFVDGEIPSDLKKLVDITPYVEDELALILPSSHSFTKVSFISKETLYNLKFLALDTNSRVSSLNNSVLEKNGIDVTRLKIEMEFNSVESLKTGVQAGLGAAFVSISSIRNEIELGSLSRVKIEDIRITRTLFLVLEPNRYNSKASEHFNNKMLTLLLNTL
jgi:DNA-binding transcriptional LysR family regulator